MVKFQVRWMKKRYKRNQKYRYKRYSIDFPTRLNEKIEQHMHKNFNVDFAARENIRTRNHKHNPDEKQRYRIIDYLSIIF